MNMLLLAWIYVVVLMALIEALSSTGTVLGAFFTLLMYGVFPTALLLYFALRKLRRRAAAQHGLVGSNSAAPDGSEHATGDPIAPVREKS